MRLRANPQLITTAVVPVAGPAPLAARPVAVAARDPVRVPALTVAPVTVAAVARPRVLVVVVVPAVLAALAVALVAVLVVVVHTQAPSAAVKES